MAAPARAPRSRILGLASGACLAAAAWLILDELGLGAIVGQGRYAVAAGAAGAGAMLGWLGLTGILWTLAGTSVAALTLVAWTPLVVDPVHALIRTDPFPKEPIDAVLVLSGAVNADGLIGGEAIDRLLSGMALAKAVGAGHLVLSSVFTRSRGDTVWSDADVRALVRRFGPGLVVDTLGRVRRTRDEALGAAALARQEGWKRVAVVTSPLHSRRACAAVEQAGATIVCRPAEEREYAIHRLSSPADRVRAFRDWVYESLALRVYRIRGWIR
jgi:uncharacterized SAM-binding protein YcdF (DUF218 family)